MLRFALIIIAFQLFQNSIFGQSEQIYIPYSFQYNLQPVSDYVTMPEISTNKLKAEDSQNIIYGLKSKRFAKDFNTDFHLYNSGEWQSLANGGKVWRFGIRSVSAYSIYLVFGKFQLEKGISLFIYNNNYSDIIGPVTFRKNNRNNVLPVAPVPGDEIVIELNVPPGIEYPGELTLTKVWHDYTNEFGNSRLKAKQNSLAGSCNIDINCPLGAASQIEKQAVCKLIANGELCTGTMVNNIRGEKIPYFLTAYHCVEDSAVAASSIVIFNYENPYCNAITEPGFKTLEGASLVATTPNQLDFSLLRLNGFPPIAYRAYLAGWESDPVMPLGYKIVGVKCIHHPGGDVKKISYEKDTLVTGSFGEGFLNNGHWVVRIWENGVTEGGSSGAPIFNNNHRVVGTLTGGDALCGNPVNDYFSKFSLAWDYYSQKNKQLKAWLDPDNTGATFLNGVDPYGFNDLNCDTFKNISINESVVIEKNSTANGYISGHNSQLWQHFAEKFHSTDTTQIAEIIFNVAKAYSGNYLSYINLNIWKGQDNPDSILYSQPIFIKNINPKALNYLRLDTVLQVKGTFFIGYSINYITPADTFALYYASKRADNTSTMYIKKMLSWYNIKDVTGINYPTSLDISYIGCKNLDLKIKINTITNKSFKLYPNPCITNLIAEIQKPLKNISIHCYDINGKVHILPYEISDYRIYFNVSKLKSGIYWLSATTQNEKYTGKFVVTR